MEQLRVKDLEGFPKKKEVHSKYCLWKLGTSGCNCGVSGFNEALSLIGSLPIPKTELEPPTIPGLCPKCGKIDEGVTMSAVGTGKQDCHHEFEWVRTNVMGLRRAVIYCPKCEQSFPILGKGQLSPARTNEGTGKQLDKKELEELFKTLTIYGDSEIFDIVFLPQIKKDPHVALKLVQAVAHKTVDGCIEKLLKINYSPARSEVDEKEILKIINQYIPLGMPKYRENCAKAISAFLRGA